MRNLVFGFVVSLLSVTTALADQSASTPSFVLLPSNGDGVAKSGSARFSYSEGGGSFGLNLFGPFRETSKGWILYDFGLTASLDDRFDVGATSAYAGLVYRYHLDDNSILGFNAYIDGGRQSGNSDFMGLASIGVEYENRFSQNQSFVQLGGNAYFPFDDYTNIAKYGRLSSAPRSGVDAYASYGRSFDGYGIRGTISAFDYFKTDSANALTGYRADIALEYWRGLPEGMSTALSLGVRDDNRVGVDPAIVAEAKLNWTFGNTGSGTVSTHDCAVVRDAEAEARIDCGESVIRSIEGPVYTKGGQIAPDLEEDRRLVRVNPPQRHLGFGSPFTPIEYTDQNPTLQLIKTSGGGDGTFTFSSTVAGLPASMTTAGGTAQSAVLTLTPGLVTITETNIPAGWALDSIVCTGATTVTTNLPAATVDLELAAGDDAVCTYNNRFTLVPAAAPTPSGGTLTLTPEVNQFQLTKIVVGGQAPVSSFGFTGTIAELTQTLVSTGGTETITGQIITLPPGNHSFTEDALPNGFAITGTACSISGTLISCSVENTFTPPVGSLQIVKSVVGDTAPASDFTFDGSDNALDIVLVGAGGVETINGTAADLAPGTYTIDETALPANFAMTAASCTGATFAATATGVSVDLAEGDVAVCTIENTFTPPPSASVQIVKSVVGATAPAATFTFDGSDNALDIVLNGAGGAETISGAVTDLTPGTYTIDETALPAGFTFDSASCTGATFAATAAGVSVDLADGDAAVCTIVNAFGPPEAQLTILKQTNGDAAPLATSFTFDGSDNALDVTLTTPAGANQSATSGPITLTPGTYTLREVNLPDFWTLTGLRCDNGATVDFPNGQVSVDLANGDDVTCTYTNTFNSPGPTGTIQLVKRTSGFAHGARDFIFTSPTGSLNQTLSVSAGSNQTVSGEVILLPVGTHEITEAFGGGFIMQSIQCDDGSPTNTGTRTATVDLAAGENVICTYINNNPTDPNDPGGPIVEPGRLIIEKRISGDCYGDYSLGFDIAVNGRVIGQANAPTCANGALTTEFTLGTGTFTISERNLPPGWSQQSLVCDSGTDTIALADFDIRSCTIENEYDASVVPAETTLTIVKQTVGPVPAPATDFTFRGFAGTGNFTISVPEGLRQRGEHVINATPGTTYRIREQLPADWTAIRVSCTDGSGRMFGTSPNISTVLAQGEQVVCFVDNEYTGTPNNSGTVTIVKQTVDGASPAVYDTFRFSSSAGPLNTSIPVQANGTSSSGPIIVEAGAITLSETRQSDWELTSVSCSNGANIDLVGGTASFDLADQEDVTCTYVNRYKGGGGGNNDPRLLFTMSKQVTGQNIVPADFNFEWTITDDNGISAAHPETLVNVFSRSSFVGDVLLAGTGTMVLSELNLPGGFELTDISCNLPNTVDLAARTVTIPNLENGNSLVCTITNNYTRIQPTLTIIKNTAGDMATATQFSVRVGVFSPLNFTVPAGVNQTATPYSNQNFAPGNYAITEGVLPTGWDITALSCDDGSVGDLATRSVNITLDFGDAVTCTIENTYTRPANTGSITFVPALDNQTTDGNGENYIFTGLFSYYHNLNANNFEQRGVGDAASYVVNAGTYTIQQPDSGLFTLGQSNLVVGENYLDRIECTDGTNSVTNSVSVDVAAGEDVICTFYNVMINVDNTQGWITLRKAVLEMGGSVAPAQDITFSSPTAALAQTLNVGAGNLLATGDRIRVPAGSHTITEDALPVNWTFDDVACNSADGTSTSSVDAATRTLTVDLVALDRMTCTFINRYNSN